MCLVCVVSKVISRVRLSYILILLGRKIVPLSRYAEVRSTQTHYLLVVHNTDLAVMDAMRSTSYRKE